ncbi:MAG: hypothetical protein ACM31C_30665 [Acidobacteriota bacterium]
MKWALVAVAVCGCGTGFPPPKPDVPAAPDTNDPAFAIQGLRGWYLVGDGVTPGDDQMTVLVTAPASAQYVDAYVGTLPPVRMERQSDGFGMQISIADLAAGDYSIVFTANDSSDGFAAMPFHRSAPYYVLVSTDYDFSDPSDSAIDYMNMLHARHPGMRITHFWAPYTYTDPMVSDARRAQLDAWILQQRDTYGDEIGLHIHPYCNFVVDAGLTCITDQSDVYPAGDTSGYTIMLGAYGHDGMSTLLQHAATIFNAHHLGTPKTFRAGGWTATLDTLLALQENGYIADTSALNWQYIQNAWRNHLIASWTMQQWMPIGDTSQPYYPSQSVITSSDPAPDFALLEVPDNGVMIDYTTVPQLEHIFDANFPDGSALLAPTTMMMGFHPSTSFSPGEYTNVDTFLSYADKHLAATGLGPVVYITLSDVTPAFAAP